MFDTIGGIPLHPLIVHGVVVLSPRIRAWAGILTPITATIALIMVPFATQSGEALEKRVAESAAVEEHAELGDSLVFFVLFLALAAWALWFVDRRSRATAPDGASGGGAAGGRPPAMLAVMVLCVIAVLATTVQVVRIGHSGASSVWDGVGQQVVSSGGDGD